MTLNYKDTINRNITVLFQYVNIQGTIEWE